VLIPKPRFPIKQMALMGWLPSPLKKLIYRLKGYRIGKKVAIGFGSVIVGDEVSIGEHSSISFFSFVRGRNITIGEHVHIGATTFIDTPIIEIGDGTKINEQVFVGGLQFPDSKLVVGRNCQIMQMSFINPAKSITIGDDSGIGGDCLLFGHNSWLSQLEGYPVEFEPIEIGKSVSVSWRVFVLPGVKIGDGAVVGANSLVSRDIPPRCLALGYPARVVSRFPYFPKDLSRDDRAGLFRDMVKEMITYFQSAGLGCEGSGADYAIYRTDRRGRKGRRGWRLRVGFGSPEDEPLSLLSAGADVLLSFDTLVTNDRKDLDARRVTWFDVEKKETSRETNDLGEEVALFLRRYGIRFFRAPGH
jgi:acetyltransferase-like isoleucine patch superfamily enzyme